MAKKSNLITDYNEIRKLSFNQKVELSKKLAKRANVRMKNLEVHNLDNDAWAYGKAKRYLSKQFGKQRFYEGKIFDSTSELNRHLQELTYFLNAKSSTIKGIKEMNQQRYETFAQNHNLVDKLSKQDKKSRTETIKKYMNSFYEFLSSPQFKDMRKRLASDQLMDDFALALEQGYTLEEIQQQYFEEQTTEITFEKVQEKYNRAKWQLGQNGSELLK